jgi:soluble lytic murein transglycosylase-like protein
MLQVKIKKGVKVKDKRRSLGLYFLMVLIAAIGFALTYGVAVPVVPGNAVHQASPERSSKDEKEAAQQAVLRWMKENSRMPEQVLAKIYSVAMESVNADLILAICLVESNFNPHVESGKGAVGLMGIMPGVWLEELEAHGIVSGKEDLFTISKNIDAGAFVLERYLKKTDNLKNALSRYAGGDPSYAARVLRMQNKITLARRSEQQLSFSDVQN